MSFDCIHLLLSFSFALFWYYIMFDCIGLFFFFKQKTAYEMRISDWSSDVCSSDLGFQDQEGDHVFLHPGLDRLPARQHADRRQQCRQQDEEQRYAVDAEVIGDAEGGQPFDLLDELKIRRMRDRKSDV